MLANCSWQRESYSFGATASLMYAFSRHWIVWISANKSAMLSYLTRRSRWKEYTVIRWMNQRLFITPKLDWCAVAYTTLQYFPHKCTSNATDSHRAKLGQNLFRWLRGFVKNSRAFHFSIEFENFSASRSQQQIISLDVTCFPTTGVLVSRGKDDIEHM